MPNEKICLKIETYMKFFFKNIFYNKAVLTVEFENIRFLKIFFYPNKRFTVKLWFKDLLKY